MSCPICIENYNNTTCIPVTLTPCGHGTCQTCLDSWNGSGRSNSNTCPSCRQIITSSTINRTLLDIMDGELDSNNDNELENRETLETIFNMGEHRPIIRRINEVLHDKCGYSFVVIDNSGSMEAEDGKSFSLDASGKIQKSGYITRWEEATSKTRQIMEYNLSRGMTTRYYLLNPKNRKQWIEGVDYIELDPSSSELAGKKPILARMLSIDNIRGSTPLDMITNEFKRFLDGAKLSNETICYNLITDGEPNNKNLFRSSLQSLARTHSVFIVVNLCTDEERVIEYYNELDTQIGNEISGLDVIDDLEGEQREVTKAGNDWFVYSFGIHLARMSGCYSVVGDGMDEGVLPIPYIHKLIKEVLKLNSTANIMEPEQYLQEVERQINGMPMVYNYTNKRFEKPINLGRLGNKINPNANACTIC